MKRVGRVDTWFGAKWTYGTVHKREGHEERTEGREADPTPGTPGLGDLH